MKPQAKFAMLMTKQAYSHWSPKAPVTIYLIHGSQESLIIITNLKYLIIISNVKCKTSNKKWKSKTTTTYKLKLYAIIRQLWRHVKIFLCASYISYKLIKSHEIITCIINKYTYKNCKNISLIPCFNNCLTSFFSRLFPGNRPSCYSRIQKL